MNDDERDEDDEDDEKLFQVLSVGEMRAKYYSPGTKPPKIALDPAQVPPALRHLIPLAERWGISDDILREDAREAATAEERREVDDAIVPLNDEFDAWLAGPEAYAPPGPEYLAFTCLRMFSDGC